MSFITSVLQYNPSLFLDFNRSYDGSVVNLGYSTASHEFVGSATPVDISSPITPSRGIYGGGIHFIANAGNTIAGSCAYRVNVVSGQALRPTSAVTVFIACNAPDYNRYGGFISCTQSGGWTIEMRSDASIRLAIYINGAYLSVFMPPEFTLPEENNLLMATYDGRYARLYHNGILMGETDAGANYNIGYAATVYNMTIGCEVGTGTNISDFLGLPVEFAGVIPNNALSPEQIESLYLEFATQKVLSGNLTQSNLSPGKYVRIRSWYESEATKTNTRNKGIDLIPDETGDWSVVVPDGEYEIVLIGDEGYAPQVHGPVVPG